MTTLKNKYTIGCHVMFYEIEMYKEYIDGLINLVETVKNKENIYIDLCFNISEYFEKISDEITIKEIKSKCINGVKKLKSTGIPNENLKHYFKTNDDEIYNIASYRRDLNYNYCTKSDFIMWGETDSFFPREAFKVLETIKEVGAKNNIHKYILNFADRKMWDSSWDPTVHVDYEHLPCDKMTYEDLNYAKSALPLEKMNEINSKVKDFDIRAINRPQIDGSCLVISSDLIKSGVNLPHSLLLYGDDTSIGSIAQAIMKDKFIQFTVKNVLKVHARRHPKKRLYISGENNPNGFCGDAKGDWSVKLDQFSKHNLHNLLGSQNKFLTFNDLFDSIES